MKLPPHELGDLFELGVAEFKKKRAPPKPQPLPVVKKPQAEKRVVKDLSFNAAKLQQVHKQCAKVAFLRRVIHDKTGSVTSPPVDRIVRRSSVHA